MQLIKKNRRKQLLSFTEGKNKNCRKKAANSSKKNQSGHHEDISESVAGLWLATVVEEGKSISLRDASQSCCSIPNFLSSNKPRSTAPKQKLHEMT